MRSGVVRPPPLKIEKLNTFLYCVSQKGHNSGIRNEKLEEVKKKVQIWVV